MTASEHRNLSEPGNGQCSCGARPAPGEFIPTWWEEHIHPSKAPIGPGSSLQANARRLQWFTDDELEAEVARRAAPADAALLAEVITYCQMRRRDTLRALRACVDAGADYWRWQGHAELARQLLERLGAEVPQ